MRTPVAPRSPLTPWVALAAIALLGVATVALGTRALDPAAGLVVDDRPVVAAGDPQDAPKKASAASGAREQEARRDQRRVVRAVQERLAELGWYGGAVDGIDGAGTRTAVRGFQRATGLVVDGVAGPTTRRALRAEDATTRVAWEASRPAADPTPSSTAVRSSRSAGSDGSRGGSDAREDASASAGSVGSANSPSPSRGSGPCDVDCRGRRILGMTPLSAPDGYSVDFRPGRPGLLGLTHSGPREIVVWLRADRSDREVAATLLHEIGHAYDFAGLGGRGDAARQRWADARGFDFTGRAAWFGSGCSTCTDFSIGAGDLAESVHACWAPGWDTVRSQLGGRPTAAQCDLLRQILR